MPYSSERQERIDESVGSASIRQHPRPLEPKPPDARSATHHAMPSEENPQDPPPPAESVDLWPTLGEATGRTPVGWTAEKASATAEEGDDWEFVAPDDAVAVAKEDGGSPPRRPNGGGNPKILHRSASTPDFGNYDAYSESETSSSDGEDAEFLKDKDAVGGTSAASETSSAVLVPSIVSAPPVAGGKPVHVKRVPSFKDAILLNAKETAREQEEAMHKKVLEEKLRRDARHRRPRTKPRLVVTPIKRCAKSTGDLRSLVRISEHEGEEDEGGYGGGGGGGFGGIAEHHEEDEVLGDTDASDFYARKAHGQKTQWNGMKERPDEAKRKEIIMYKKEQQRLRQQQQQQQQKQKQKQGAGGGGGKKEKSKR